MTMHASLRATGVAPHDSVVRRSALLLLMSYLTIVATGTGIGLLLRGPLDDMAVVRFDQRVAVWFSEQRTPDLNDYTMWGSGLADTRIKIALTAVLRLEGSPVDSSFPSGHTAAAAAYGALVVVVFWHTRNLVARGAIVLCAAVTAIVGLSQLDGVS